MLDEHILENTINWGVRPVLFHVGNLEVPSYSFFLILAVLVGFFVYFREAKKSNGMSENTFFILVGALIGATLGAKIPIWIMNYKLIISNWGDWFYIFNGRTIVGGLIGGPIGVFITKKILGIKERKGNLFAPAIAIGDSIGRIGCFLRGCCFGKETILPWGVDFGDGVYRHPTQIYESIFSLGLFFYLIYLKKNKKDLKDGELFTLFMNYYFIFRFLVEFIRVEEVIFLGLTFFQIAAIFVLVFVNRRMILKLFRNKDKERKKSSLF